jgi:glycerate kinase
MEKYIIMPDSFKGSMSSVEVCEIMKRVVQIKRPDSKIVSIPIADGGEGTVDCFIHVFGGEKVDKLVTGPFGEKVQGFYGIIGNVAVIETAAAAGFSAMKGVGNPAIATTFGVGELIKDAIGRGSKKIILGLGGSCTNDGGVGMANALGVKFYDSKENSFLPTGNTLSIIDKIDITGINDMLADISIEAMCDINNPLYGPRGAAHVFAPQKGADPDMVEKLDYNLKCLAKCIDQNLGINVSTLPGGGAAGGMGAGAFAFLNAELRQGIDVILDLLNFEELIKDCDAIFTGEGKLDKQSLEGKVVIGIARRAKLQQVPVIAVVGCTSGDVTEVYDEGVTAIYTTAPEDRKPEEIVKYCKQDLENTMKMIL